MGRRVLLLDVVGLTPSLIGDDAPRLRRLAAEGAVGGIAGLFPALTCSSQASLLTGVAPSKHGVVGNGWYFRELQEIWLWRQSHGLIEAEDLHARVRREHPGEAVARLFLWYAMGAPADVVVTPRPRYKADGRKEPDCWTQPAELRDALQAELGRFPLFQFWGPGAGLASSRWIVDAARRVWRTSKPRLQSVYVPHLDYDFQRYGPDDPRSRRALREVDALLAPLIDEALADGAEVIVFSEYGIEPALKVAFPNRALRGRGLLATRDEDGELLDPVLSRAFAVCDHQIAHVYVKEPADLPEVARLLAGLDGVAEVLDAAGKARAGIDHRRSGELVLVAELGAWFAYPYWLDDRKAPDFARCVEIHRKPGYDPAELFFDPRRKTPKFAAAWRLAKRALGFRAVMDLIGLDATVVRGTHGRLETRPAFGPALITSTRRREIDAARPLPFAEFPALVDSSLRGG